jgi:hypothetical protein
MTQTTTRRPLGRIAPQPARLHLKLSAVLVDALASAKVPNPPPSVLYAARGIAWDMYGNDQYGDCVEAGYGHLVNQVTFYGSGSEFVPTTADVLGMYSAITGFNPKKPSTDQGTYIQDALAYARKTGLDTHKIVAYAAVDPSNTTEVMQSVALFGQLLIGMNFPDSAMDQFDSGDDWDVVKGAKIEGGHCVLIIGYDAAGLDLVTWGKHIRMTWAFWSKYVDEAWVILDADGVQRAGAFFTGLASFYALGEAFTELTGETNPVPQPVDPSPVPDPTPTPEPGVYTADQFVGDVKALLSTHNL